MQTRTFIVLLFLAIGLMTSSSANAARNSNDQSQLLSSAQRDSIISVCDMPKDVLPSAMSSLRNYFKGKSLNSTFFQDFIWVHPEYVEFARCVVCLSGIPNDPHWESGFHLSCQDNQYTTLAEENWMENEEGFL